jgi:glycine oxidase
MILPPGAKDTGKAGTSAFVACRFVNCLISASTMKTVNSPEVIIAGAGIIGVSIALELRERGLQVLVLDRGEPGQEASSAAAGMLAASAPDTPFALQRLAKESARMFPDYVRKLESLSGMQVDLRSQGTIALLDGSSVSAASALRTHRKLSADELRRLEPAVAISGYSAFFVEESSVDPVLLMRAALKAAAAMGIEVRGGVEVREIRARGGQIEATTVHGRLAAAKAINCRGAWSGAPIKPRKGQMLAVHPRDVELEHVIHAPGIYLVPRSSGRLVIGATVEDVGFDKTVEPETIQELHHAAVELVPELASAEIVASWAGLRPGTPDDLPTLGKTEVQGVFTASGHYRNGILLAPVTARIMANLCTGRAAGLDISAFSPLRFAGAPMNSSRNSG